MLDAITGRQQEATLDFDPRRQGQFDSRAAAGLGDDGAILDAVNLNNLDDWTELHNALS